MISHALIDDLQITLPGYLDTLDGFRKWVASGQFPQRGQVAYLDKEIFIDMSPERLESHNKPKSVINRVLGNLVGWIDRATGSVAGDIRCRDAKMLSLVPPRIKCTSS